MDKCCPRCGVDVSRSSGVVCPACSFVLVPGSDSAPLLDESKSPRGPLGLILSFLIPGGFVTLFAVAAGGNSYWAALAGAIAGVIFVFSWLLAGRVSQTPLGRLAMGVLFFVGCASLVAGVFIGGCIFAFR